MGDVTKFWRHPRFDDLCLLKARFILHRYELHTHPTYVIAVVTQGCERLRIGTRREVAPAGSIIIVHPEECHDGEAGIAEGWSYRTLYPSVALMCDVARELGRQGAPVFGRRVIDDHFVADMLWRAHQAAEGDDPDEAELAMLMALRMLIMRYAESDGGAEAREHSGARQRFALYEDAVDPNQGGSFDLRGLAQLANVTRFQVIRDFKRVTGLTPGAYVRNRRLRLAGRLIEQGTPIVDAALAAGFADQSHLSRSFRSTHGITPRTYRRAYRQEQEGMT
jgi:AraC-like DNA-binding protein